MQQSKPNGPFAERKRKKKTCKMANDEMDDCSKNNPAEKCRRDRPSNNNIKIKYLTIIFKLHQPGYDCQFDYR